MPDVIPVKKHWVVAAFTPSEEDGDLGAIGAVNATLYASLSAANGSARQLAAESPGTHYVLYEAEFYTIIDVTPVQCRKVVTA